MQPTLLLALGASLISGVIAHPHHDLSYAELTRRSHLSKRCEGAAASMNRKRWAKRNAKRDLAARAANTTYTITSEAPYYDVLQNNTCILTEEVTTGPYIWPRSQTLRQDMTEGEPGVPLYLDIGVMDVNSCEPLPDVLVDVWHCNSTGSYSSFTGLSPDTPFSELLEQLNVTIGQGELDLHTDDTTFLRGMWPTDENGITEIKTIFPGYYVERTVHIHVQVHDNWVVRANGTVASSDTISTGQIFAAEDLTQQIVALEPYASHTTINRTTNAVDSIYSEETKNGFDPVLDIVPLDGSDPTKGMVGYITIGVDKEAQGALRRKLRKL
ncbi:putative protocatechuate -dioxygenase beta subunit protein [Neofusicoccum parvum UCRNP2]|uniref:Putative protocatechuate-dioxygenase beta subunit protein n=1 Tax=Botryosphaeria parva (strain UCR-NP2) TaxID=1287680 RepID=R1G7R9_BOTPV|nr:putative protocatechuate -dioxygenase beta subunit protein [Neofusicoccum parvum UCRNP2]